jgi:hypothetical protein
MVTRNAYLHFGLPRPAGVDQAGSLALDLGEAGDDP